MKNDYKKISDKIIKEFNIYSANDKGFVDDYVEYVGNNLISSGEWQDIDDDIKKNGNDSEYDKFSDSNDYTSEEFIKSNKTNFLDIFRSIYNSFKSFA